MNHSFIHSFANLMCCSEQRHRVRRAALRLGAVVFSTLPYDADRLFEEEKKIAPSLFVSLRCTVVGDDTS
jgi:hypothetical protein